MRRSPERLADAALAAFLAVVGVLGTLGAGRATPVDRPVDELALGLVVLAAVVLAARRRWPLAVLAATTMLTSTYLLLGYPYGPVLVSFFVAVYTVARHRPLRQALAAALAALAVLMLHVFVHEAANGGLLGIVPGSAWVAVPFAVGLSVRVVRQAAERERAELVRQRIDEERLRVAQEVHDVVGHGLAAINMQANVALHVMDRNPGQAQVALEAISRSSAEALQELRATLAVVREADAAAEKAPAPGLHRLDELMRRMTEAGMDVRVEHAGPQTPLPAPVDLAAYRVVQESLTNVLRHSPVKVADVLIRHDTDAVTVTVTNPLPDGSNGHGEPAAEASDGSSTGGLGIPGMRHRVEAVGGRFTAGVVDGGFEVHAVMPVREAR